MHTRNMDIINVCVAALQALNPNLTWQDAQKIRCCYTDEDAQKLLIASCNIARDTLLQLKTASKKQATQLSSVSQTELLL